MWSNIGNREEYEKHVAKLEEARTLFHELVPPLSTADGLLPTSEILKSDNDELYLRRRPDLRLYPHWRTCGPLPALQADPALWKIAAIRVTPSQPIACRAPIYGVSFRRALGIVLQRRFHKSRFYIPEKTDNVWYSELLVHLWERKESNGRLLSFECWQWIGTGEEVNYAHMIMQRDGRMVTHLDGALVAFEDQEAARRIFDEGEKKKGISYEKDFRLDGLFSIEDASEIIGRYFPTDKLISEYFEEIQHVE